jgi:hypothetical protein
MVAQSSWVFEQPLKPAGTDASFVLFGSLTQKRGPPAPNLLWIGDASRVISELVLAGPIGKTWRNAFEP